MEAANVVLLPAAVVLVVWRTGGGFSAALALALGVNAVLLTIGACYWRVALLKVQGDGTPFERWLPRLARAEPWALALTALCVAATVAEIAAAADVFAPERIAAFAMTVLAVLEFVNYYRVQLQYFDTAPDFKALVKRRRLKPAHMARDIAAWRARRGG
jgi:anaerobic C4-dicarboxylate transporter